MSTYPSEQRDPSGTGAPIEGAANASPSPGADRERSAVSTTRQRAEEQRRAKHELVREQVESGSLVIRQMTAEERRRYPPRAAPPNQRRGRGR
jgi:hypothetical protein